MDTITLYVNGELVDAVTLEGYAFPENNEIGDFFIGGNYTGSKHYSAGDKMIRFRIFDTAPTADEAAALYASYEQPEMNDQLFFNVDFTTGSSVEQVNQKEPSLVETSDEGETGLTFLTDPEINKTVANFNRAALTYTLSSEDYANLTNNYTLELYANIADGNGGTLGGIFGTEHYSPDSGVGFLVNGIAQWGVANEILAVSSSIFGLIRLDKNAKEKKNA